MICDLLKLVESLRRTLWHVKEFMKLDRFHHMLQMLVCLLKLMLIKNTHTHTQSLLSEDCKQLEEVDKIPAQNKQTMQF